MAITDDLCFHLNGRMNHVPCNLFMNAPVKLIKNKILLMVYSSADSISECVASKTFYLTYLAHIFVSKKYCWPFRVTVEIYWDKHASYFEWALMETHNLLSIVIFFFVMSLALCKHIYILRKVSVSFWMSGKLNQTQAMSNK